MRVEILVNCRAGSLIGADVARVVGDVQSAFAAKAHDVAVTCAEPDEIEAEVKAARARNPDALVIGGGDGTVRAAAWELVDTPIALGILPLGTMNRLARDLRIPFDPVKAAGLLATAPAESIDVGEVNGRIFLCNALVGLPVTFARDRQALRGRSWSERIPGYVRLAHKLLSTRRRIRLDIDDGRSAVSLRALSLVVSNNAYSEEPSVMLTRRTLDGGELALYVARHRSGWSLLGTLLRAIAGRWRTDPEVTHFTARKLRLDARAPRINVSNDGELETLQTPLVFTIRPKALRMLVPRQ